MKIVLTDISAAGRGFTFTESFDFSADNVELDDPLQAKVMITREGEVEYGLVGELQARVLLRCDRCGRQFEHEIGHDFAYTMKVEEEPQLPPEYDSSHDDCETIYLEQPFVESREILAEQLLLAVPIHRLCKESCKGLCDGCGVDLNETTCQCGERESNSPFAVLKKISK
ncbi:MAG: DUF177 domain-containing protein [Thermodesulfobacteriota bacterium]